VWCGTPPDGALLAPCCLFACAIVAWAIAALGALLFAAQGRETVRTEDALAIGFIACVLVVALHLAPAPVSVLLAVAMAAHAALIAISVAADYLQDGAAPHPPIR
jgi:hypothetical protein